MLQSHDDLRVLRGHRHFLASGILPACTTGRDKAMAHVNKMSVSEELMERIALKADIWIVQYRYIQSFIRFII